MVQLVFLMLKKSCGFLSAKRAHSNLKKVDCTQLARAFLVAFILVFSTQSLLAKNSCRGTILMVDGYSSSDDWPTYFTKLGYRVVHMHTDRRPPALFAPGFNGSQYQLDLAPYSYDQAMQWARELNPLAIFPGTEMGIEWAHKLRNDTGLNKKPNLPAENALLDKFDMLEYLRARKIPVPLQYVSNKVEDLLDWISREGYFERGEIVVIKPTQSAGANGFVECKNEADVRIAFAKIFEETNIFDRHNQQILAQKYLKGRHEDTDEKEARDNGGRFFLRDEFVVNTVTSHRRTIVTDMWQYVKEKLANGKRLYSVNWLLPPAGELQDTLIHYNGDVLRAFDARTDLGHSEIIMTSEGPRLVEIGFRMMGGHNPLLVERVLGRGPMSAGVLAFTDPVAFDLIPERYENYVPTAVVTLNVYSDGKIFDYESFVKEASKLPGYVQHYSRYSQQKAGDTVLRSEDLLTALARVQVSHSDQQTVEDTVKTLLEWSHSERFLRAP